MSRSSSNSRFSFELAAGLALVLASQIPLSGCNGGTSAQGDGAIESSIEAEVSSEISTVVTVRWDSDQPTRGYVEFGTSEEFGSNTPISEDAETSHEALLLGLVPDTEYYYRVVTTDGDVTTSSPTKTVTTGALPSGFPLVSLEVEGDHDKYTVVPILGKLNAMTILNPDGEVVWYYVGEEELEHYRGRLSVDGKSVVMNAAKISGGPSDKSALLRVSLDGTEVEEIPQAKLAHDFVEHADGTLAALAAEYREEGGREIRGERIIEIDLDGESREIWNSWDCFDPEKDFGDKPLDDSAEWDWTFANAIDYDPDEEAYYVGMRNFSSIAKILREDGTCDWVLGDTASTFEFEGSQFLHQHQFDLLGDKILVFDNDGAFGEKSRVLEYELKDGVAREIWDYTPDPEVYVFVLGEPERVGDDVLVTWSTAGTINRITRDGDIEWEVGLEIGSIFGFSTVADSMYVEADAL